MKIKEDKRKEAKIRQTIYDKLTTKQKIDKLDKKLGREIGAKIERQKLLKSEKEK